MTYLTTLDPSQNHQAICVPIDKYSTTTAFKKADLYKKLNENRVLIKEAAIESLIGFIGIIHLYKGEESPPLNSLEISIRFHKKREISKRKALFNGITIHTGVDNDTIKAILEKRLSYPWMQFFPSDKVKVLENFSNVHIHLKLPKPVPLKEIKQE